MPTTPNLLFFVSSVNFALSFRRLPRLIPDVCEVLLFDSHLSILCPGLFAWFSVLYSLPFFATGSVSLLLYSMRI